LCAVAVHRGVSAGSAALLLTDDALTGEVMRTNGDLAHYVLRDRRAMYLTCFAELKD
jgi:hypothetical protein